MKRILGALAAVATTGALVWGLGCSSGGSANTCTQNDYAPASGQAAYADTCTPAGGQCGVTGSGGGAATGCPQGMRLDTTKTCGGGGYGYDPTNNCGPAYGGAVGYPAAAPCCMPIADAGDGGADGSDDGGDADAGPSKVGLCATETCNAGCSCGILPQDGQPHCLCLGADGGASDGGDAASSAPNCGTIYCFAGCSCHDFMSSSCGCP